MVQQEQKDSAHCCKLPQPEVHPVGDTLAENFFLSPENPGCITDDLIFGYAEFQHGMDVPPKDQSFGSDGFRNRQTSALILQQLQEIGILLQQIRFALLLAHQNVL